MLQGARFPTWLAASVVLTSTLFAPVLGHMMIDTPAVFRSKTNPYYAGSPLIDYSMTNPLSPSGSDFPCKKYHVDIGGVSKPTATLVAGSRVNLTLSGSATHEGGSCQFSLSYDRGKTFGVVYSVIGGCPLSSSYAFNLPSNVPAGVDVLLAWTWFNRVGNREMYMNCAHVNVQSSVSGSVTLQRMFEANNMGDGTCRTIEGTNVDFNNPAGSVTSCPSDRLITPNSKVTLFGNGQPGSTTNNPGTSTNSPTSTPTNPTGGCNGVAAWNSAVAYTGGQQVSYGGHLWTAKWWTQNDIPGGAAGVWTDNGACRTAGKRRFSKDLN